jgi:hypothetical protein
MRSVVTDRLGVARAESSLPTVAAKVAPEPTDPPGVALLPAAPAATDGEGGSCGGCTALREGDAEEEAEGRSWAGDVDVADEDSGLSEARRGEVEGELGGGGGGGGGEGGSVEAGAAEDDSALFRNLSGEREVGRGPSISRRDGRLVVWVAV